MKLFQDLETVSVAGVVLMCFCFLFLYPKKVTELHVKKQIEFWRNKKVYTYADIGNRIEIMRWLENVKKNQNLSKIKRCKSE